VDDLALADRLDLPVDGSLMIIPVKWKEILVMIDKAANSPAGTTTTVAISGMTCGGCVASVTRVLSRIPGVAQATVDLGTGRATIVGAAPVQDIVAAVQAAGYGAQPIGYPTGGEDERGSRGS
jgi:copper chaperone